MSNPKQKESTYIVDNIKEAYELMHLELGPNAQLYDRKKIRQKGVFGFLKPRKIQVVATVDYDSYLRQNEKRGLASPVTKPKLEYNPNGVDFGPSPKRIQPNQPVSNTVSSDVVKILEKVIQEKQVTPAKTIASDEAKPVALSNPYEKAKRKVEESFSDSNMNSVIDFEEKEQIPAIDVQKINQEIEDMKTNMKLLMELNQQKKSISASEKQTVESWPSWLKDYQFSELVLDGLEAYLKEKGTSPSELTKLDLDDFVRKSVEEKVNIVSIDEAETVVLVGPTGVGKTTTLSKIATRYYKRTEKAVGFITFDVFRIGAVQQLEIYADILESDIKVVYDPQQLSEAITELRQGSETCESHELILIDSIGRSYRDEESIQQLKEFVEVSETNQIALVLNASTNYREIRRIMEKYQMLNYSQIILTKLDESERSENILNICYEFSYPISFVCTGQMVVNDIEVPTVESLTKYILEGVHHD